MPSLIVVALSKTTICYTHSPSMSIHALDIVKKFLHDSLAQLSPYAVYSILDFFSLWPYTTRFAIQYHSARMSCSLISIELFMHCQLKLSNMFRDVESKAHNNHRIIKFISIRLIVTQHKRRFPARIRWKCPFAEWLTEIIEKLQRFNIS